MSEQDLTDRLAAIEAKLDALLAREVRQDWYTVEEFANHVGAAVYTVREWCRHGRVHAEKAATAAGRSKEWRIGHAELERYRQSGLLPLVLPVPQNGVQSGRR